MSNITGVVERMSNRAAGTGVVYSIFVGGTWYGGMWEKPECGEGDTVTFSVQVRGNYSNVAKGSLQVVSKAADAPPNAAAASGDGFANSTQQRIEWQAARNSAVATINMMLSHGIVVLPKKQAEAYEATLGLVQELTIQYCRDTSNIEEILAGDPTADYLPSMEE